MSWNMNRNSIVELDDFQHWGDFEEKKKSNLDSFALIFWDNFQSVIMSAQYWRRLYKCIWIKIEGKIICCMVLGSSGS